MFPQPQSSASRPRRMASPALATASTITESLRPIFSLCMAHTDLVSISIMFALSLTMSRSKIRSSLLKQVPPLSRENCLIINEFCSRVNRHGSWFCYADPFERETWAELPMLIQRLSPHPTPSHGPSNGQPLVLTFLQNVARLSASANSLRKDAIRIASLAWTWSLL